MHLKAAFFAAAVITAPALAQPAPAPSPAQTSDTLARATPDMRRVIEKLLALGAKPLGTQSVAETRAGPSPADAVKAVLKDEGKDAAALAAATGA